MQKNRKKKVSKKQQACVKRYVDAHYDRTEIKTPKGMKDDIKAYAERAGQSMNAYICQAILDRIVAETDMEETEETEEE